MKRGRRGGPRASSSPMAHCFARGHTPVRVVSTRARVTMGVRVNSRGHLRASSFFSLDNACASINVCSHKLESFVMATPNEQLPGKRFVVPLCSTPPAEIHRPNPVHYPCRSYDAWAQPNSAWPSPN